MVRLFAHARFDFLAKRAVAFSAIGAFIAAGLVFLSVRGLNESIEFTGGTLVQIEGLQPAVTTGSVRSALAAAGLSGAEIKTFDRPNELVIRAHLDPKRPVTEETSQRTAAAIDSALTAAFGADAYRTERVEAVGPKVGGELRTKALLAILMAFGAILVYIWLRFEWRFAIAAVLATLHDILATVAFMALLDLEITLVVVAALLTIVGYSLNDTIITFDRVRENLRKYKRSHMYEVLNLSINETLPRTVLTSGTTLLATLALLILAGEVIRGFAWVMTFGIVVGTFSSIFIASPILLWIERRWPGEDARGARSFVAKPAEPAAVGSAR